MKKFVLYVAITSGLLMLAAVFKFFWENYREETPIYKIEYPVIGDISKILIVTGNIEPRRVFEVKSETRGIIKSFLKEVGNSVVENDTIATLTISYDAGRLIAAQSRMQQAEINFNLASKDFERNKLLYEKDIISRNNYELSEANYLKRLDEKTKASSNLETAGRGAPKVSDVYDVTQVRTGFSGIILAIPDTVGSKVAPGSSSTAGTTIAIVADMNDLVFKGTIDASAAKKMKEGMPITISSKAIPNKIIDGVIESVTSDKSTENGPMYEIVAALKNLPESFPLKVDMDAEANITVEQVTTILKLPESLIEYNGNTAYIYSLTSKRSEKQVFEKKKIETGLQEDGFVEVKSGIGPVEKIRGEKIENKK